MRLEILATLLDQYPPEARPISPPSPLGNAGGLSGASLFRYDSPRGPLVARAWPSDGPDAGSLARIHGWIARAGGLGFVPVPLSTTTGQTLVFLDGRSWEVAPWMPGLADLDRPPRAERLWAGFAGLAAFHARVGTDRSTGPSPGLQARAREVERLLGGEFDAIRRALPDDPTDTRVGLARIWVDRARQEAPGLLPTLWQAARRPLPLQPCLRDARPDHFLFEGDRLTGLVDFGAMGRDTVAGDLARLFGLWVGGKTGVWEARAHYARDHFLSDEESAAIDVFLGANALLGAGRWVRWHFLERRSFRDPEAVGRGLRLGLERLDGYFGG